MIQRLLNLYHKHSEAILYLFFGGLTTVVNYIVYLGGSWLLPVTTTTIPNLIAWVISVLFAYLTNRLWVFRSEVRGFGPQCRELVAFAGARVFTLVLESVILWGLVDMLHWSNLLVKLGANVLVIVLNYVFSKLWIFKKRPSPSE